MHVKSDHPHLQRILLEFKCMSNPITLICRGYYWSLNVCQIWPPSFVKDITRVEMCQIWPPSFVEDITRVEMCQIRSPSFAEDITGV